MSSSDEEAEYVEESSQDPRILQLILDQAQTTNWEKGEYKPYNLIKLERYSVEYDEIESIFEDTNRGLEITNIARVENPFLLGQYLMKKEKLTLENPDDVTERSFFHGTKKSCLHSICKSNFDWRRRGESCGHKFGQGVSFAPEVSYARHYTDNENVFSLVKVLVGQATIGYPSTEIPPEPYDTTKNSHGTVYVKYEDDDFYPEYVITCYPTDSLEDLLEDSL